MRRRTDARPPVPPSSPDSEKALVASVLVARDGERVEILDAVPDRAVFDPCLRGILQAAREVVGEGNRPDPPTLEAHLGDRIEKVGGPQFLRGLFAWEFVPTAANWRAYAKVVMHDAWRREVLAAARRVETVTLDGGDLGRVQRLLDGLRESIASPAGREPRIRFFTPAELRAFTPDDTAVLVGDCHITRGSVAVLGGQPGIGKSRAATYLARCGATGDPWFGLPVHARFRTIVVQAENGRHRLRQEFAAMGEAPGLDDFIRISEPPPFGLTFGHPDFVADIKRTIEGFGPDLVVLDPWNATVRDDGQRDYLESFDAVRAVLPTGEARPALLIVAHTRKPASGERRTGGSGLMHLLSGSHVLSSVPRSVFIMLPGSDDETDDRVVLCNPKNNDGEHTPRTAWRRGNGLFVAVPDFDWSEFDRPPDQRKTVRLEHLAQVFRDGERDLTRRDAARELVELVGITERAAYNALASERFAEHLCASGDGKRLGFQP